MFWSAVVRNKTNFRTCGVLQKFNAKKKNASLQLPNSLLNETPLKSQNNRAALT
jgi:hypothetical protein